MSKPTSILTGKYVLWLLLALPAILVTIGFLKGTSTYDSLMHTTGEFAGRFLVIALIATPLILMFPKGRVSKWLLRNRRFFGVAAFAYTFLHALFYVLEVPFAEVVEESAEVGLWTAWIAFLIFIPLAMTSTDYAVRKMGKSWKKLQRWVYLAAILTFLHWGFVHWHWGAALFHFVPVLLLQVYRVWKVNSIE